MTVAIRHDAPADIRAIVRRSPVWAVPGAVETLRQCLFRSIEVCYGLVDNEVACVWGLITPTHLSTSAYIWLLTTDIAAEHKFLLVRHSQRYVEEALKKFPSIIGDCIVGDYRAVRWLKWLGAEFMEPVDGRVPFTIRKK